MKATPGGAGGLGGRPAPRFHPLAPRGRLLNTRNAMAPLVRWAGRKGRATASYVARGQTATGRTPTPLQRTNRPSSAGGNIGGGGGDGGQGKGDSGGGAGGSGGNGAHTLLVRSGRQRLAVVSPVLPRCC